MLRALEEKFKRIHLLQQNMVQNTHSLLSSLLIPLSKRQNIKKNKKENPKFHETCQMHVTSILSQ